MLNTDVQQETNARKTALIRDLPSLSSRLQSWQKLQNVKLKVMFAVMRLTSNDHVQIMNLMATNAQRHVWIYPKIFQGKRREQQTYHTMIQRILIVKGQSHLYLHQFQNQWMVKVQKIVNLGEKDTLVQGWNFVILVHLLLWKLIQKT